MNRRLVVLLTLIIPFISQSQHWSEIFQDNSKNFYEKQAAFESYWDGKEYERSKGYKQFKRWEWFWKPRVSATGELPDPQHLWKEYQSFNKHAKKSATQKSNADWSLVGPSDLTFAASSPGIGRTAEVEEDPNDPNTIYVGTPAGGLWKTTDGGTNWQPLTDHLPTLGVSGIAVDPIDTDIIYIATGDGDANDTYSLGVLKSFDGGQTWNTTGLSYEIPETRVSHKLMMHPDDHLTLFAATDNGLFKTINGGDTWYLVKGGDIEDMEFHPTDPSIIYANGSSFYRSTDGGENFTTITAGLPSSGSVSRWSLAVSEDEPDWVYLLAGASSNQGFLGIYRSMDQGLSFDTRAESPNLLGWSSDGSDSGGQAWYDLALEVDPDNANRVFVGGVNLWRSTNGGGAWNIRAHWIYPSFTGTYVHADIHDLKYIGDRLYCLSDGGIFISTNDGSSFTDITEGLSISQFYRIGTSATDPGFILAGAQDNGTIKLQNGSWGQIYGGDGMNCLIHPTNTNRYFVSTQYGNIRRTNNGGNSFVNWVEDIPESGAWVTPYMLDPNDANTLYVGYESLWRRTGNGAWFQVSEPSGNITQFNIAPSNSDVIFTARGSLLSRTVNGGDSWSNFLIPGASGEKTSIAFNPEDENEVYITISGFVDGTKIFKTTDGGDTWENISLNLPNFPCNTVVYEEGSNGGLYVGMDVGVYYIDNDMANWMPFDIGLPRVPVSELEIQYSSGKLRAATYGRGVWETDLFTGFTQSPIADFESDFQVVCAGDSISFTDLSTFNNIGWDWDFPGADVQSSTLQHPKTVYSTPGFYEVSLTVSNTVGDDTETRSEYIQVLPSTGEATPFTEGFETIVDLEDSERWTIENPDNDITWEVTDQYGYNSSSCLWLNNFNNGYDRRDRLYSTSIDLSDAEEVILTMDVAFAQQNEDNKDKLRVYISEDCGFDWDLKKTFTGHTTLLSVDPTVDEFFPSGNEDWHSLEVTNISGDDFVEDFRFYLYFENDGGNNVFVDNINLYFITTGLEDIDLKNLDLNLYPNPSTGHSTLEYTLLGDREVDLRVMDITGRVVYQLDLGQRPFGQHRQELDLDLSSGIYTLELSVDGKRSTLSWAVR